VDEKTGGPVDYMRDRSILILRFTCAIIPCIVTMKYEELKDGKAMSYHRRGHWFKSSTAHFLDEIIFGL
jgi:hypothetical protein